MAGQQRAIGHDIIISHVAIVADVASRHEEVGLADDRVPGEFGGPVNRDVFAKNVARADDESRGGAVVLNILRGVTDHCAGMNVIAGSDFCMAREISARTDFTALTQIHVGIDHHARANPAPGTNTRARRDDSGGMDDGGIAPCGHWCAGLNHAGAERGRVGKKAGDDGRRLTLPAEDRATQKGGERPTVRAYGDLACSEG